MISAKVKWVGELWSIGQRSEVSLASHLASRYLVAEEIFMKGMKLLLLIKRKCATLICCLIKYLSGVCDLENQLKVIDTTHD